MTNTLGIPDVYLNIINNNISESNINAKIYALKMFYYDSLALQNLNIKNNSGFFNNTYKWSAGSSCLDNYISSNDSYNIMKEQILIIKSIYKLQKINHQADNNLGGHIIFHDYGYNYENNNYIEINSKYSESELCKQYLNKT